MQSDRVNSPVGLITTISRKHPWLCLISALESHLNVWDPEIVIRCGGRLKTECLVEGLQTKLGAESDRLQSIPLAAEGQCSLHQCSGQTSPSQSRRDGDAANSDKGRRALNREKPKAAGQLTLGPSRHMPRALIEAIEVGIRGALLDDKNILAKAQQFIELIRIQVFEAVPLHRNFRHAGHRSLERR